MRINYDDLFCKNIQPKTPYFQPLKSYPMRKRILCFLLILPMYLGLSAATLQPSDLRCEYLHDPQVVDVSSPRLSWINFARPGARGVVQGAWQVRVASDPARLNDPDLWDSGKVESSQNHRIAYDGEALQSRQECWWQVRVWDAEDEVSEWSEPAFWRMGLLSAEDWEASWIGAPWQGEQALPKPSGGPDGRPEAFGPPAPLLRKSFGVRKPVEKAVIYTTGLGYFELYLNGRKVGDDVLIPNQTNYGKRPELTQAYIALPDDFHDYKVMYLAYDLTDQLQQGENVLGSILGNGFYNPAKYWADGYGSPRFLAQLHVSYEDGTEEIVVSDGSWTAARSPILMDMVYYGETYDARLEQDGWNAPGFDASTWEPVALRQAPEGRLVAHTASTDKVTEVLEPKQIERLGEGHYRVDFGEEISGWVRLHGVSGPAGHAIDIEFLSSNYSGDNRYILRGDGAEDYAPRFNWFVFREIEIHNWPGELSTANLTAEAVNTQFEATAHFKTSNPMLNAINRIWRRSQVGNMHGGIVSDCPHRERSGYTGDGQVACATVFHNYDARDVYHKWIGDIRDAQIVSTGYVPNGAPWQSGCGGGVAWGAAISIMPWEFYQHYGSLDMLENTYPAMKGYLDYLEAWKTPEGIVHSQRTGNDGNVLKWFNLGDWVAPGELPDDALVHTFYYWHCAELTAKTAAVLGHFHEAAHYAGLAEASRTAFRNKFFDATTGSFGDAGADILALRMGLDEPMRSRVIEAVRANLVANDGHLDTGIFGTRYFFEMLAENGMNEQAYTAITKTTQPGFGWWLEQGATTTWEKWDGTGSRNHPMFGGGLVWLYRDLAGMQIDPEQPAYEHIVFRPQPVADLDFVEYSNQTVFGEAGIRWERGGDELVFTLTVPVGATATLHIPTPNGAEFKESGISVTEHPDVTVVEITPESAVLSIASGRYRFHP